MTRSKTASTSIGRPAPSPRTSAGFQTGHTFRNPALLETALTHSSLLHEETVPRAEEPGLDNEQLEFLGDAVLSLTVAESLFRNFPSAREGDLTRMRASVVSSTHLAVVAGRLDLGSHLRFGRGEERSGGRRKPALLGDALEAVIAALYLDGGLEAAARFVEREVVSPAMADLRQAFAEGAAIGDYKSALQERLQASGLGQGHLDHRRAARHQRSAPVTAHRPPRPCGRPSAPAGS